MTSTKTKVQASLLALSAAGAIFISTFENGSAGPRTEAYLDPVAIPTICTGHIKGVTLGMRKTVQECETLLQEDSSYAGKAINRLVHVPLTQGQYDALVSFTFNVGAGALRNSTLLYKLNLNDCVGSANEFLKWDHAKGKILRGLTKRRVAEHDAFIKDCNA